MFPLCILAPMLLAQAAADIALSGRVVDENNAPVAKVRIKLARAASPAAALESLTDPAGVFTIRVPEPGDYLISAERPGYYPLVNKPAHAGDGAAELTLILNPLREVFETVEVSAAASATDLTTTAPPERVDAKDIALQPYSNTHDLRTATRLLPSVTRDSRGGLHIAGGSEEQNLYLIDGFNLGDPVSGRLETRITPEAARSLEVSSSGMPAEYGKSGAGVLAVNTISGDDRFRYSGTNFIPGIQRRKDWILNAWTPRMHVSGPIRRSRVWFANTMDLQYDTNYVEERPRGENRAPAWRIHNLLRNQANLTSSNILSSGFLINYWTAQLNGLTAIDPPESTVDRRSFQRFFYIKDQAYFGRGMLVEFGYAGNRTQSREIPQGYELFRFTTEGRRGNFFVDSRRRGSRDQFQLSAFLPEVKGLGAHSFKVGAGADRLTYEQSVSRTGYENFRVDGTLLRRVVFDGPGDLDVSNWEYATWIQDSWRASPTLLVEAGVRLDHDRLVRRFSVSPRIGGAWQPAKMRDTRFSAAYSLLTDATRLRVFSRPYDQWSLTNNFRPDGTVESGPGVSLYIPPLGPLKAPRYHSFTVGFARILPSRVDVRVDYTGRRGYDGLTYLWGAPAPAPPQAFGGISFDSILSLSNRRRDVYDGVTMSIRQSFTGGWEYFASYTRARAHSNAVSDLNVDDPVLISDNSGRMPWDMPNRWLGWGSAPAYFKNWAIVWLVDARTGAPFSIQDDTGQQIGEPNAYRLPNYFELNLHIERRFRFKGYRWGLRFGANNITGHHNPNTVNNITSSPNFLNYYGGQGRAFVARLRWLERDKK